MDVEDLFGLLVWILIIVSAISRNKKKKAQKAAPKQAKQPAAPWEQAAPAPAKTSGGEWEHVLQNATGDVADVIRSAVQSAQQKQSAPAPRQMAMPLPSAPLGGLTPLTPTVHTHLDPDCETHDAPGSLGTISFEGKDPCHEEQFTPLGESPVYVERPGLQLDLSGHALTQAFIMQEVLTRPCDRRPRGCAR